MKQENTSAPGKPSQAGGSMCYIIMPISTPDHLLPRYNHDRDHFKHVLEHLLVPAAETAGLTPVRPSCKGTDLIHADIVRNLETADVVLCDMSILNPNVFFELGIRTALNKPVCLVLDDQTARSPFDTTILNHHTYSSALTPWSLSAEIAALSAHILASVSRCTGMNPMWKYFGLSTTASPYSPASRVEEKVDLIALRVDRLRRAVDQSDRDRTEGLTNRPDVVGTASRLAVDFGFEVRSAKADVENRYLKLLVVGPFSPDLLHEYRNHLDSMYPDWEFDASLVYDEQGEDSS